MKQLRLQVNVRISKDIEFTYDGGLAYETIFVFPGASFSELSIIIERFNALAEQIAEERIAGKKD